MLPPRVQRLPRRLLRLSQRRLMTLQPRSSQRNPRSALFRPAAARLADNLQLRAFSRISARPPVPVDEYDELKRFLADPETQSAERAKNIVTGWMQEHVYPNMPGMDATVMVMVADAMQDEEFVMQVYTGLRDAGVEPSPLTLVYTAAACAQLGDWRTALEVIEFMHQAVEIMQPSIDIYENAIKACHADKKWMRAKHLLEEMRTYGLEASPELHVASVRLCIDSNEPTATRVLLQSFLRIYGDDLDTDEQREILIELFHAAVDAKTLPQALFFREEMLARGFAIPDDVYTQLIQLCAVKRQWHRGRVLLGQYLDINAAPPEAAPSYRYTDDALSLLREMRGQGMETPLAVYNAALRNFGQICLFDDASSVYSDMREQGVAPDATSFAALMCSCGGRVEDSERFFQDLKREGCRPTLDVVHAYLLVPSRSKQWEEVLRRYDYVSHDNLFKKLPLESDVRIQALVAVAYGRLRRSEDMLKVFTSMKVKGMEPNLYVYGEALFAYIRQGQWRHSLMLFDHLFQQQTPEMQEQRALENFPMLWDAAVVACGRGEQTERAAVLYETIVQQRVQISPAACERLVQLLTSVPTSALWESLKPMARVHRRLKENHSNPRVLNAVLMRAVEENDDYLAEQILRDAVELKIKPNSMTYALMLRLYSKQEDQANFCRWWHEMERAKVKTTVFMFRALMYHLQVLGSDCEDPTYLNAVARFLQRDLPESTGDSREIAAELGRAALDAMEDRGMQPDALCLSSYLLLSQEPEHVARVLSFVESALLDGQDLSDQITPRLFHTLFTALEQFPDGQRVRKLLVAITKDLPSDLSEDALAAYCASNDGSDALLLLREILDAGCSLKDEHVLFFLTNSYTAGSVEPAAKNCRPRSANGVIVDMSALLLDHKEVNMEAACLAFLIQHVVELSKWQQRDVFDARTQEEIHAMKQLLVRAFSDFSSSQVSDFLSKVVDVKDMIYLQSVVMELQEVDV